LSAWNAHFSSPAQALLWRLSAVTLCGSGLVIGLVFLRAYLYEELPTNPLSKLMHYVADNGVLILPCLTPLLAYFLLYFFARVDLVVECFINLAYLPDSALLLPQWSQYVPHIT
jgi:hypothetical protein